MAKKGKGDSTQPKGVRIRNRKAFHDYEILEKLECGLALVGTEVKSLRAGQAKVDEAYARFDGDELFLVGANIALYPIYFHHGWAKCEIGIARGKQNYDKRDSLRKKDQQRDMARAMRQRR